MVLFLSFLWLSNIPLYICTTFSLSIYLLMGIQVASGLGYCKQCCYEHWGACVFPDQRFLGRSAQEWDCWIIWQLDFQFFKEPAYCLPQWLHQFTFPPTTQEGSFSSTPSLAFIICRLFNDGYKRGLFKLQQENCAICLYRHMYVYVYLINMMCLCFQMAWPRSLGIEATNDFKLQSLGVKKLLIPFKSGWVNIC